MPRPRRISCHLADPKARRGSGWLGVVGEELPDRRGGIEGGRGRVRVEEGLDAGTARGARRLGGGARAGGGGPGAPAHGWPAPAMVISSTVCPLGQDATEVVTAPDVVTED